MLRSAGEEAESFANDTERFVFKVARNSFLSVWSYANPRRSSSDPRELCDILVVCEPDIIIISVKECRVDAKRRDRWRRKAVEKSVNQIYGAERSLERLSYVVRRDGTLGISLPEPSLRRIHRVSVSLGGDEPTLLAKTDNTSKIVHILNEVSFITLTQTLDTVADFINYLNAKEALLKRVPELTVEGGEEDLLAYYLYSGRVFPEGLPNPVPRDKWNEARSSDWWQQATAANEISYRWDSLIDFFGNHALSGTLEYGNQLSQAEAGLRVLAREDRFGRRILGDAFDEFHSLASKGEICARTIQSPSGTGYVFLSTPPDTPRAARFAELHIRCLIARRELDDCETVIGIGTNTKPAKLGFAWDLVPVHVPEWTEEHEELTAAAQRDWGIDFSRQRRRSDTVQEYPSPQTTSLEDEDDGPDDTKVLS